MASSNEDHLQFHDIDKYECLVDEFHIDLNMLMTKDPTLDTKAAYDATRMMHTEKMSREERALSSRLR